MRINFLTVYQNTFYKNSCENVTSLNFLITKVNHSKCKYLFNKLLYKAQMFNSKLTKLIDVGIVTDV